MVNVMDQDQQWLLNCLNTTLDPNQETRSFPEASLHPGHSPPSSPRNIFRYHRWSLIEYYFSRLWSRALSKVAVNKELPFGLRQISSFLGFVIYFNFFF